MDSINDFMAQQSPQSVNRRFSGDTSVSEVFGFPIAANQFSTLQSIQSAESQSQLQREEGLVDPRTTRHLREAAKRAEAQGILADGEIPATVLYIEMHRELLLVEHVWTLLYLEFVHHSLLILSLPVHQTF